MLVYQQIALVHICITYKATTNKFTGYPAARHAYNNSNVVVMAFLCCKKIHKDIYYWKGKGEGNKVLMGMAQKLYIPSGARRADLIALLRAVCALLLSYRKQKMLQKNSSPSPNETNEQLKTSIFSLF